MATTEKVTIEIVGKDGVTTAFGRAATATEKLKGAVKSVASGFSTLGLAVAGVEKRWVTSHRLMTLPSVSP